jgi:hypothetical protein
VSINSLSIDTVTARNVTGCHQKLMRLVVDNRYRKIIGNTKLDDSAVIEERIRGDVHDTLNL